MTTVLSVDDVTKRFGGIVAVDGLDLAIEEGELVGLIGPNGAGKTTTLNLITGFLDPDEGTVSLNGEDVTGASPDAVSKRGIGRTFQISKPFGRLSVYENLLVPNVSCGPAEQEARIERLLEELQLEEVRENRADELSGGQKKLLELARVLMLEPDLILLDEPAAGVNPVLMDDIMDDIRRINANGTAILVIEHDMSVISELCERVVVMNAGRNIASGTFEEIRDDEKVREAYLGGT
ncbi:ABC transporter ATP-binding protein [Halopenitus persicus]|uniref:Amino acid/amide ABC transporter ATP-binding protein 1, HAAT family n=1 Tax=Halopenitus persicus TaxID=1048396 RepID=A0A1H3GA12_9EURY|nr:ABC transporter ATP-binding protein [Halopenitus persicus]SDY00116.1 amino acid/amide ABC transporter ATP-binding protein 1, HAAT family [Halopenitus persicus]